MMCKLSFAAARKEIIRNRDQVESSRIKEEGEDQELSDGEEEGGHIQEGECKMSAETDCCFSAESLVEGSHCKSGIYRRGAALVP